MYAQIICLLSPLFKARTQGNHYYFDKSVHGVYTYPHFFIHVNKYVYRIPQIFTEIISECLLQDVFLFVYGLTIKFVQRKKPVIALALTNRKVGLGNQIFIGLIGTNTYC